MTKILSKIVAVLLILAAIGGLIFSIAGLVFIWQIQPNATKGLQDTLTAFNQTLEVTAQGLSVTKDSLKNSVETIGALESTVETIAKTIETTGPLVNELNKMMKEDLPNTISSTQTSLRTAQESAQVIDTLLGALSGIPLIGSSIGYTPQVPLSQALGDVADSLDGLPASFSNMEGSLKNTQDSLETFEADLTVTAASIGQIQDSVAQYEQVIDGYQQSVTQMQTQLEDLSKNMPQIVRTVTWALTFFLVWMIIVQFGLFTQGWERLARKEEEAVPPDEKPKQE